MPLALSDLSPAKHDAAANSSDDSDYDPRDPLASLDGDSDDGGENPSVVGQSEDGDDAVEDLGDDEDDDDDDDDDDDEDGDNDDDDDDDEASDGVGEEVMATVTSVRHEDAAVLDGKPVSLHLFQKVDSASIISVDSAERLAALRECISHENTAAAIRDGCYVARVVVKSSSDGEAEKTVLAVSGADEVAMVSDLFKSTSDTPEWPTLVRECEGGSSRGLLKPDRAIRESHGVQLAVKGGKPKVALYSLTAVEYAKTADKYKKLFERYRAKQERAAKRRAKPADSVDAGAAPKQTSIVTHIKPQAESLVDQTKSESVPPKPPPKPAPKPAPPKPAPPKPAPKPVAAKKQSTPAKKAPKRPISEVSDHTDIVAAEDVSREPKRVCVVVVVAGQNLDEVLRSVCQ